MNIVIRELNKIFAMLFALCCLLIGCDEVNESERYVYVKPAEVSRAVLIEDFTGQRCIKCPNAADEITRLQEEYGEDKVIAVGIHGGALAVYSNAKVKGLRTALGDEYNNYWNVETWPTGIIDRQGQPVTHDRWSSLVRSEIEKTSPVTLSVSSWYDEATNSLFVDTDVFSSETKSCKLQVWLTEDGIVAPQQMPDGSMNQEYVHNHVLRAAVNGTWGEGISLKEGEHSTFHHSIILHEEWEVENLSFVVFVYDDNGVIQVSKTSK